MTFKNLLDQNTLKTLKNSLKNNLSTYVVVFVLVLVMAGLSQVLIRNLQGDRASANISSSYMAQVGLASVDTVANGAFPESQKICQTIDGACQADGLIDYDFTSLTESTGVARVTGGGIILDKNAGLFVQNGSLTSKIYIPKSTSNVTLTKIQVGVGLKPETLVSVGYSIDGGSNYQTAVGNFTNDQLKAQSNQNVVEYILPTSTKVNQGFSYRIALKSDSKAQTSPSLKFVRVFYDVAPKATVVNPIVANNTVISPNNIGSGTCTPAIITIGATTACTWDLINGPAGTTYYISQNDIPNGERIVGQRGLGGVVMHSQASETQITSLRGVKNPAEFNDFDAISPNNGTCSVANNKLVCVNVIANGNLTPGNKFVDPLFRGSTPPIDNEIYGNPAITLNKAPITLTAPRVDIVCLTRTGTATVTGQIGGALNPITGLEATCDKDAELTLPGGAKINGRITTNGTFTPNPNQIIPLTTTVTGNSTLSSFGNITISTNLTPAANSGGGGFLPIPSGGGGEQPANPANQ